MRAVGAAEADSAIIALGEQDFEAAVLGTALLRSLGVGTVIARASGPQRGKILMLAGASRVVYPEAEMGEQVGALLLHSSISSAAQLPSGFGLAELKAPAKVAGKTLAQLGLRQSFRLTVVAVTREETTRDATPDLLFEEGDLLLVAGRTEKLDALARTWDAK
jgi:trk system potassium uptake protein TrkA